MGGRVDGLGDGRGRGGPGRGPGAVAGGDGAGQRSSVLLQRSGRQRGRRGHGVDRVGDADGLRAGGPGPGHHEGRGAARRRGGHVQGGREACHVGVSGRGGPRPVHPDEAGRRGRHGPRAGGVQEGPELRRARRPRPRPRVRVGDRGPEGGGAVRPALVRGGGGEPPRSGLHHAGAAAAPARADVRGDPGRRGRRGGWQTQVDVDRRAGRGRGAGRANGVSARREPAGHVGRRGEADSGQGPLRRQLWRGQRHGRHRHDPRQARSSAEPDRDSRRSRGDAALGPGPGRRLRDPALRMAPAAGHRLDGVDRAASPPTLGPAAADGDGDGSEQRHGLHLRGPRRERHRRRPGVERDGDAGHGAGGAAQLPGEPGQRSGDADLGRGGQRRRCDHALRDPPPAQRSHRLGELVDGGRQRRRPVADDFEPDERPEVRLPGARRERGRRRRRRRHPGHAGGSPATDHRAGHRASR